MSQAETAAKRNALKWFQRVIVERGVAGLKAEFNALKRPLDPATYATFEQQPPGTRNRYKDVVCLDKSRVLLKGVENDYIHASVVASPMNPRRFICAQGPTDATCGDFWRMIVQERSNVIIMLCNLFEKQMPKCAAYFPERAGQTLVFDGYTVECKVQKKLNASKECLQAVHIQVSGLAVKTPTGEVHFVDHYQWIDWPDRGVAPPDLTAVQLLAMVRPCKNPIVIHCSAGIGRTGSLVLLEYLLELCLLGQPFDRTDEILLKIREQRAMSIQTDQQYLFVQRVLLQYLFTRNCFGPEHMPHIQRFVAEYNKATL